MKLKQLPEDFQVEELTDRKPDRQGPHTLYLLRKRSLGTPEAIQQICRAWHVEPRRVSFGGLKDRHAETLQYLTIHRGPRRSLKLPQLTLRPIGQLQNPFSSRDIRGNRFRIVLRGLDADKASAMTQALEEVRRDGVPNYFDDQRFGSVRPGREAAGQAAQGSQFVGRKLIEGDYEGALKLALIEPYEFDGVAIRRDKQLLARRWGDWSRLQAELPAGDARLIVGYLADHPADFRGAVARLRADLKSLYLAAYQSHVWNHMLSRWLQERLAVEQLFVLQLRLAKVVIPRGLSADQRNKLHAERLPLPSARLKLAAGDPLRPLIDAVMEDEGLKLDEMKLKHFREPFFSRGERAAFFVPLHLRHRLEPDERHAERQKLLLHFDLPRGSYATMLVKRIGAGNA